MKMWAVKIARVLLLAAISGATVGCTTLIPRADGGLDVGRITAAQARHCTFLRTVVSYDEMPVDPGNAPKVAHQDRGSGIQYAVAVAGGNAYVMARTATDSLQGRLDYDGEVYRCP